MSRHALEVLEFERVLERVAQRASSEPGRARIRSLRPATDPDTVRRELDRVSAVQRFVEEKPEWAPGAIPDVRDELTQLGVDGAVLEPSGLHRLGILLATSRGLKSALSATEESYPELSGVTERLVELKELEEVLARSVDEEGNVTDRASRELKGIRDRLRGAQARIVRKLEAYLRTLPERFLVGDASVTIREGRYVIPVRREGKGEVGGIVHDESQTGATLYIEPPVAIEATNELRGLEREEAREIRRVLGELTGRVAAHGPAVSGAFHALVDFDALHARARAARAWGAAAPEMTTDSRELVLREARHPLLVEAGEGPVVPYDLSLEEDERCLMVSGPNTGGKSVFLKATGLIAALAQSGVVPPVGPGTRLPLFASFYADIGDEQSIARNLSTFSAHLENLSRIVHEADEGSLVLIDEMGTGTDPAEGAALARAILEELVDRGATTVVSSHLGELKRLDAEGSRIVNASLQFDSERMEPTYRLVKGRPGRSYGLAIARRLGLPDHLLDKAERYVGEGEASLEDVLERLEQKEAEVEELLRELDSERARTRRLRSEVEDRAETLEEAERTAEDRARAEARQMLLDAREEVERAIEELRTAVQEGASLDEAATRARSRVEAAARTHREERERLAKEEAGSTKGGAVAEDAEAPGQGDRVRIRSTGAKGRVAELRDGRALVEVGAMKFEVSLDEVERVEGGTPAGGDASGSRRGGWTGPDRGQAKLEIDLRGLRVDEMEIELSRALDQAVLEDLAQLRIIHGKGTGALRSRVGEMLKTDGRVTDFRMGAPGEGGAGVTVATFKK